MTNEIKIEQRPDAPVHFLVVALSTMWRYDDEPDAIASAKALTAGGHKAWIYRSVAEFEPILKPKKETPDDG